MLLKGCFTIERNIRGLTTQQIEARLGFRRGRLTHGARILALDREPYPNEYESLGSTFFPNGAGLNAKQLEKTKFRPGAWLGQRLVKVEPNLPHSSFEWYPRSSSAAEQWRLIKAVPAHETCRLTVGETYRG